MVPFWGRCTTHFRTYFSGEWDVHCKYDLDFDPWPYCHFVPIAPRWASWHRLKELPLHRPCAELRDSVAAPVFGCLSHGGRWETFESFLLIVVEWLKSKST